MIPTKDDVLPLLSYRKEIETLDLMSCEQYKQYIKNIYWKISCF